MKKPEIFFNPISGSSVLSITWHPGPLGDAVEANNGIGIGFFAHNGELLSVQFDDVEEKNDHQVLKFERYQVDVTVKKGKVSFVLHELDIKKNSKKRNAKNDEAA
jgi:hypothetical protein